MAREPHPISKAVRELRTALDESQQQFAYRMKTAIRTISRWETIQPPKGETLKLMARIAQSAKRPDLATMFERASMAELTADPFTHRAHADFTRCADGSNWGYLVQWMEGAEEEEFGRQFYVAMNGLRGPKKGAQYRQALKEFAERIAQIRGEK